MGSLYPRSEQLFTLAQQYIPGGVNSPVRAFRSVGGTPLFMRSAKGALLFDEDGKEYIDCISSWGAILLGHTHPQVVRAMAEQLERGTTYGTPTHNETLLAQLVTQLSNVEQIRMVSSGTEACMSAVRLARGYTQRKKIITFEGCYHGHADMFLLHAGSGLATFSIDRASGVTEGVAQDTLSAVYNDIASVEALFRQHANDIAAVIVEPVAGNMGCVPPVEGFLPALRDLCTRHGAVLIFDEVMTGFRLSAAGAQGVFQVQADLVCYGKIIGGGMPAAAFGGKKEILKHIAPSGTVYQAGTLSGNPMAVSAGLATLSFIQQHPNLYETLANKALLLAEGLRNVFAQRRINAVIQQIGSMISVFFTDKPVENFTQAKMSDLTTFNRFFHGMLAEGVYLPPSGFESWFLNHALDTDHINTIIAKAHKVVGQW